MPTGGGHRKQRSYSMIGKLSYRRPMPADYPALLALFAEHGWKTDSKLLASLLAPANAASLCCYMEGQMVGFFLATVWGRTAWTGYLIVVRALRGHGIGQALKQRLLAELKAVGVTTFRNVSAERLHGFQSKQFFDVERRILVFSHCVQHSRSSCLPDPDIEVIVDYDCDRFGSNRGERLRKHLCGGGYCNALAGETPGKLLGYALAWPIDSGYRIGPIVHEQGIALGELLDPLIEALPPASPVTVCLYADDIASVEEAKRLGFRPNGEALQFIGGADRVPQDARLKSIWGRATG